MMYRNTDYILRIPGVPCLAGDESYICSDLYSVYHDIGLPNQAETRKDL